MAGETCPVCGVIVLRSHVCRASAVLKQREKRAKAGAGAGQQLALVEPVRAESAARARKRVSHPCPDHPGEIAWACPKCLQGVVPPPADWRSRGGDQ